MFFVSILWSWLCFFKIFLRLGLNKIFFSLVRKCNLFVIIFVVEIIVDRDVFFNNLVNLFCFCLFKFRILVKIVCKLFGWVEIICLSRLSWNFFSCSVDLLNFGISLFMLSVRKLNICFLVFLICFRIFVV